MTFLLGLAIVKTVNPLCIQCCPRVYSKLNQPVVNNESAMYTALFTCLQKAVWVNFSFLQPVSQPCTQRGFIPIFQIQKKLGRFYSMSAPGCDGGGLGWALFIFRPPHLGRRGRRIAACTARMVRVEG
jgi:hypothetical protein